MDAKCAKYCTPNMESFLQILIPNQPDTSIFSKVNFFIILMKLPDSLDNFLSVLKK